MRAGLAVVAELVAVSASGLGCVSVCESVCVSARVCGLVVCAAVAVFAAVLCLSVLPVKQPAVSATEAFGVVCEIDSMSACESHP